VRAGGNFPLGCQRGFAAKLIRATLAFQPLCAAFSSARKDAFEGNRREGETKREEPLRGTRAMIDARLCYSLFLLLVLSRVTRDTPELSAPSRSRFANRQELRYLQLLLLRRAEEKREARAARRRTNVKHGAGDVWKRVKFNLAILPSSLSLSRSLSLYSRRVQLFRAAKQTRRAAAGRHPSPSLLNRN